LFTLLSQGTNTGVKRALYSQQVAEMVDRPQMGSFAREEEEAPQEPLEDVAPPQGELSLPLATLPLPIRAFPFTDDRFGQLAALVGTYVGEGGRTKLLAWTRDRILRWDYDSEQCEPDVIDPLPVTDDGEIQSASLGETLEGTPVVRYLVHHSESDVLRRHARDLLTGMEIDPVLLEGTLGAGSPGDGVQVNLNVLLMRVEVVLPVSGSHVIVQFTEVGNEAYLEITRAEAPEGEAVRIGLGGEVSIGRGAQAVCSGHATSDDGVRVVMGLCKHWSNATSYLAIYDGMTGLKIRHIANTGR
jgi:hypothetical protein